MQATMFCSLSIGRLLLFAVPTVFHTMNPITGVTVTGLGVLAIELFDTVYNWITCYSVGHNPISGVIINFQAETGLSPYSKELRHNISLQNDSTLDLKELN